MPNTITFNLWGINIGNIISCAVFCLILLLAVLYKKDRMVYIKWYALFLSSVTVSMLLELTNHVLAYKPAFRILFTVTNCLTFIGLSVAVNSFMLYVLSYSKYRYKKLVNEKFIKGILIFSLVCIAMYISSIWTGWIFTISPEGAYVTNHGFINALMLIPVIIITIVAVIRNIKQAPTIETILYLGFICVFVATAVMDSMFLTTTNYTAMTIFGCLILILVDIEHQRMVDEKHREIINSELKALRLQMNPHYIYNTLSSIDGLIIFDPDSARTMISKFVKHLRGSYINDIPMMISIKDEIQNLKYYLDVEMMRFPNIEVEYDIQADDFKVPPLAIQPLVENAIKHGICARDESRGKVTISTCEEDDCYKIKIIDNGIGYDMSVDYQKDGKDHIGINNTRKRLELICQGQLLITSIVGVGTEAEIIIPKN